MQSKKLPKILRQNPIQSLKDWKHGFNNLTLLDHALAKRVGHFWGMVGAGTASLSLMLRITLDGSFLDNSTKAGFGLIVAAFGYLQFVEWRRENQKVHGLEKMKELTKTMEVQNGNINLD